MQKFFGQTVSARELLENAGYAMLTKREFAYAFAAFRAGGEYCDSRVCLFNLGCLLGRGELGSVNLAAAWYWFYKAAEKGAENGNAMCDAILRQVAEDGNPISNILYGDRDTALPGLRRAMNVGMFIDSLTAACNQGTEWVPRDPAMADWLTRQRGELMEQYK